MSDTDILRRIERDALDNLDEDAGHVEADLDAAAAEIVEAPQDEDVPAIRLALALLFPVIGCAVMVGGIFEGISPRIWAGVAGILGIALALGARRLRRPLLTNVAILAGLFLIGVVMIAIAGPGHVPRIGALTQQAAASGDVTRPPVPFSPGWYAIVGWLMGIVAFATTWVAVVMRKASLALLVPLPITAVAGISVPEYAQVPSGVVVVVLFAIGVGLLSSARQYESGARVPLSYELRKFAKSVPVIAVITAALLALSQTSFLFPEPQINPAEEPQKPKTVPLDEVEDRVLFEVRNPDGGALTVSGPWRLGTLDVYDGVDWRLPAFNDSSLVEVDEDGVVNPAMLARRAIKAEFKVLGLGGAALPGLPNLVAVVAQGPELVFDERTGTLRVASGQAPSNLRYQVAAAGLPSVDDLRANQRPLPDSLDPFLEIPPPPLAARALLDDATERFDNRWDQFDYVRNYVLDEVTSAGPGVPKSIPPERVQEILGDTLEGSEFEMVAIQAMLARWLGIPARIGYGFDGGELVGDALQIRPVHGASFPEVYFPGYEWLPVIGKPRKAKPTVGDDAGQQRLDPSVLPSNDVAVKVFLPEVLPPPSTLAENVRNAFLAALAIGLVAYLVWLLLPVVRKARIRSRRRAAARREGSRARMALAYAEWRDFATDFGYAYPTDTPLMFLDRFIEDAEHTELAWLTTRGLWGDLRDDLTDEHAASAEELSRALRRRLSSSQPASMRFVAAVSRASLKDPFAPATDLSRGRWRNGSAPLPPNKTNITEDDLLAIDQKEGGELVAGSV